MRDASADALNLRNRCSDRSHGVQHGEQRSGPHNSSSRPWQQQQQQQRSGLGQEGRSASHDSSRDAGRGRSVRQSVSERFPEALSDIGVNPTPWVSTGLGPSPYSQQSSSPTELPSSNGSQGGLVSAMSESDDAVPDSCRQDQDTSRNQGGQRLATSAVNNVMCGSIQPSHVQHPGRGERDTMTNGGFRQAASIGEGSPKREASSIGEGPPLKFQLPSQTKAATFRRPLKGVGQSVSQSVSQLRPLGAPDSPQVSSGSE